MFVLKIVSFKVFGTYKFSGINVNNCKGLGLVDDKVGSGRKPDFLSCSSSSWFSML
jgi:hypothetical protein